MADLFFWRKKPAQSEVRKPTRHDPQFCLRCENIQLVPEAGSPDSVTFYDCPSCHRAYAFGEGRSLTFRWLHPISVMLYDYTFHSAPGEGHVGSAAVYILDQFDGAKRAAFVREIQDELDQPTQLISDMLDADKTEEECRKFLVAVLADLREMEVNGVAGALSPFNSHGLASTEGAARFAIYAGLPLSVRAGTCVAWDRHVGRLFDYDLFERFGVPCIVDEFRQAVRQWRKEEYSETSGEGVPIVLPQRFPEGTEFMDYHGTPVTKRERELTSWHRPGGTVCFSWAFSLSKPCDEAAFRKLVDAENIKRGTPTS